MVRAPVHISAQFEDHLVLSLGRVTLQFWEEASSRLTFILQQPGGQGHMTARIANADAEGPEESEFPACLSGLVWL